MKDNPRTMNGEREKRELMEDWRIDEGEIDEIRRDAA